MDDDVQLSLHDVNLPLCQLLLPPLKLLLLLPLLLSRSSQRLLPGPQLLGREEYDDDEERRRGWEEEWKKETRRGEFEGERRRNVLLAPHLTPLLAKGLLLRWLWSPETPQTAWWSDSDVVRLWENHSSVWTSSNITYISPNNNNSALLYVSPSLWPWARQTSAGSQASSLPVRSEKTPEASETWPTARWPAVVSGCWWRRAGCGGLGSSTLRGGRGREVKFTQRFDSCFLCFILLFRRYAEVIRIRISLVM